MSSILTSAVNCLFILSSIFSWRVMLYLPISSVFFTEHVDCMTRRFSTSTGAGSSDFDSSSTSGVLALGLGGGVGSLKAVRGKMPFLKTSKKTYEILLKTVLWNLTFQYEHVTGWGQRCLRLLYSYNVLREKYWRSAVKISSLISQYLITMNNSLYLTSSNNFSLSKGGHCATLEKIKIMKYDKNKLRKH